MSVPPIRTKGRAAGPAQREIDESSLKAKVTEVLDRWPSAGLAAGVICGGSLEWFRGHGVADIESKEPVTLDTVFRIGSLTKTFTAIAVMQLQEQGLVDLDAPANDYLRSIRLIPAKPSFRPATVRHLLTHTAGIGYWRRRPGGFKPVADRDGPAPGGVGLYSTPADLACYLVALLRGGAGERGPVLQPATLASMFQPHFQPDPRLPGMGLAFEPGEEAGHRTVGKTGIVSGFHSAMVLAPDDGIGVFALANTGDLSGRCAPAPLAAALLRRVLGIPDEAIRAGIAPRPETWGELCGWYGPAPGPVTNLFTRALFGAGAEVTVHRGHLILKPLMATEWLTAEDLAVAPDGPAARAPAAAMISAA